MRKSDTPPGHTMSSFDNTKKQQSDKFLIHTYNDTAVTASIDISKVYMTNRLHQRTKDGHMFEIIILGFIETCVVPSIKYRHSSEQDVAGALHMPYKTQRDKLHV